MKKDNDYIILESENPSSRKIFLGDLIKAAHFLSGEKTGSLIFVIVPKPNTTDLAIASISKYFEKIGNKRFFEKSIEAIEKLKNESSDKQILIDVGAGSIDWEGCIDVYLSYQIISLIGDKETLYERIRTRALENKLVENRTLEQYAESEFMPHKRTLYERATFKVDTTKLSKSDVAKK